VRLRPFKEESNVARLIWCLVTVLLILAGCENKKNQPQARAEQPQPSLEQMDKAPAKAKTPSWDTSAPAASSPRPTAAVTKVSTPPAQPTPSVKTADESLEPASAAGRTYIVQKGDTLYKIAKKFYGDGSKWKKIWEANRNRVPDPNRLKEGTRLIIP
jgi:5'-nucleotidase/UDP-sugar diphosphatase